jgi:uncharacterized membrane protein YbhN (UPF0104 family)
VRLGASWQSWARLVAAAAVLAVLAWRLGAGPFVAGLALIDLRAVLAVSTVTALTTLCCAWRWTVISRHLGVEIPLSTAVAEYYGSQFLNATLPGGVLGDVDRAVRNGRGSGDVGRGVRTVAWERGSGQLVQVVLTAGVLLALPSPLRSAAGQAGAWALVAGMAAFAGGGCVVVRLVVRTSAPVRRAVPRIALASALAVAGHTAVFLIATRTAGVEAPLRRVLPVALLVLLAAAIPVNFAGWGPREGTAAWAFAMVGLSAEQGVTVSVVYGVLALAATLPGAALLLLRRARARSGSQDYVRAQPPVLQLEGAARG